MNELSTPAALAIYLLTFAAIGSGIGVAYVKLQDTRQAIEHRHEVNKALLDRGVAAKAGRPSVAKKKGQPSEPRGNQYVRRGSGA